MLQFLRTRQLRLPIVVLAMVGWLSFNSHCTLAAVEYSAKSHPMPSCHDSRATQHAPTNERPCELECCKVQATPVQSAQKVGASFHTQFLLITFPVSQAAAVMLSPATLLLELDTGPPFVSSFAESVLQRSILAHAPPFSA